MRIFLDTNILLDMLMESSEGHLSALQLLQLIRGPKLTGLLTSQSIIDAAYVSTQRQKIPVQDIKRHLQLICDIVEIICISKEDILRANHSSIVDYEVAAQVSCALDHGSDLIVTNDKRFSKYTDLPVFTASELITRLCTKVQ